MANIKSQKKRVLTNEIRRQRNQQTKSEIKTLTKKVDAVLKEEKVNEEDLSSALKVAQKKIDMAASKGRLHKKQAARKVAQLMKSVASKTK